MVVCYMMVFNSKENNYMFRPIAAIFRLLQFCSKSIIYIYICIYSIYMYIQYIYIYTYMSILRGHVEISSSC